jgi:hypothetical protein
MPRMGERLGALQLVFCDLGTPRKEWNPYDELRAQLVERGMPATSVRFIHDGKKRPGEGGGLRPVPIRCHQLCLSAPPRRWGWAPTSSIVR